MYSNSIANLKLQHLKQSKKLHSVTLSNDNSTRLKVFDKPSHIFEQMVSMFHFWGFFVSHSQGLIKRYEIENQELRKRLKASEKQKEELEQYIHNMLNLKQKEQINKIENLAKIFDI